MADAKISALPASTTPLAGTEVLPVVQSGVTKKVAVSDLTAGRSVATGVVTATNAAASQGVFTGWSPTGGANVANGSLDLGTAAGNKGIVSYDSTGAFPGALYVENTYNDGGASIRLRTRTVDRLIVEGNGDVKIGTGNLVIGTDGKGIDFSITSQGSGTMTSELLDDYEEGTWTPEFATTGTQFDSITYAAVTGGKYIKIGTQVFIQGVLRTDAVTVGSASGSVIITGLPFIVSTNTGSTANGNSAISIALSASFLANTPTHGALGANTSQISLYSNIAGGSVAPLSMGTGASANSFRFCGTYVTN
jgi:hypothetical protein